VFFEDLVKRVRALPGVRTAAIVGSPPFLGDSIYTVYKKGHTARGEGFGLNSYNVSPAYFEAMRIPLLEGRVFTERDVRSASRVAVINKRAAIRMFGDEDPIGKRVHITNEKSVVWREIVGVVGDTKQYGRDAINPRQIYEPCLQTLGYYDACGTDGWRSAETRQRGPCASPSN
jgi:putative ABC transport system permease protein